MAQPTSGTGIGPAVGRSTRAGAPFTVEVVMATIVFTSAQQRLTVRGPCHAADLDQLVDALEAFGRTSSKLVLDVSRVSVMPWSVAQALLNTCSTLEAKGARVLWRTGAGSAAERMLHAVRDDRRPRTLISLSGRRDPV